MTAHLRSTSGYNCKKAKCCHQWLKGLWQSSVDGVIVLWKFQRVCNIRERVRLSGRRSGASQSRETMIWEITLY